MIPLGALVACFSPWTAHAQPPALEPADPVRIPVQVVSQGSGSRWMYVEIEQVPEPGTWLLAVAGGLCLLLRRNRA